MATAQEADVRAIEAMLLVKEVGVWKIVSLAWDMEGPDNPLPGDLESSDRA